MTRIFTTARTGIATLVLTCVSLSVPASAGCGGSSGGCGSSHDHAKSSTTAKAQDSSQYTCPMHPEIIRSKPGDCPRCGMKLVPAEETASTVAATPDHALPEQFGQLLEEYAALRDHFETMMSLTAIEKLGPEMRIHRNLMVLFGENLAKCEEACGRLAGAVDDESGTTGTTPTRPDRTDTPDRAQSGHHH
ncbi:MAG: heavy metal-binding domain-containing protein [Candidatus Zixiibacteriota bacterium]